MERKVRHTQATAQRVSSSSLAKISLRISVSGRGKPSLGDGAPPLSSAATAAVASRVLLLQLSMSPHSKNLGERSQMELGFHI